MKSRDWIIKCRLETFQSQNRSVLHVLKGGFGMSPKPKKLSGVHNEWNTDEVTDALTVARNIIIVPG